MTGARAFVDTNVLLRALTLQMTLHQETETLIQRMWERGVELWVSRQVLREYLVQATHPNTYSSTLPISQVMVQMEMVQTLFHVADETQAVTKQLLFLLQKYPTRGKQVHDANIVATMLAYDIDTLLTINVNDFKRFSDQIHLIGPQE
ncbi:MAG: type II toxin-antitoxin system VapC family toxin [Caldilineaceae bacterium]|nr:type II toxin-antitoxin system VapC family toxin [Caldilineaceae bacterium]